MGGSRSDARLRAVGDALAEEGLACLRIDYGPWDEGRGEQTDVRHALEWAAEEFDAVGLFGYSFGTGVGLLAADADPGPDAVAVLAPPASVVDDGDVVAAVGTLADRDVPLLVCYGENDGTVDWGPVVERAREADAEVQGFAADHFVGGSTAGAVADDVATFFASTLG